MSHQCCPPRLVLPVGGRVTGLRRGGGRWGVGGVGGVAQDGCESNRADFDH